MGKQKRRIAELESQVKHLTLESQAAIKTANDFSKEVDIARKAHRELIKEMAAQEASLQDDLLVQTRIENTAPQKKLDGHRLVRVRDSEDAEGDMIFHLHLETYDRRLLDEIAERYNLNLLFVNDYNDYERSEWQVQPIPVAA